MTERSFEIDLPGRALSPEEAAEWAAPMTPEEEAAFEAESQRIIDAQGIPPEDRGIVLGND